MPVETFTDLEVWKISMELAANCYRLTKSFPRDELFGMTNQIRRSAASVPANIAEGHGRQTTKDYLHFLSIARGSLMELKTHLLLANKVDLVKRSDVAPVIKLCDRVGQMLTRLRQSLHRKV